MAYVRFASFVAAGCLLVASPVTPVASTIVQESPQTEALHRPFDQILDVNVRDGLVYYRALRSDRGRLDRYVASLNVPAATYQSWARERKIAFWLNAYNAFVLQTVVERYPIKGSGKDYPSSSKEPRVYLALGRGAIGSGRLRSEAYSAERVQQQLDATQQEFVSEQTMVRIDRDAGEISVTPIVSWHDAEFIAAYDTGASGPYAQRSPIERALVAFLTPRLLPLEKEFLHKNQFKVTYHPFDWRLNDLTGGRPE
jgi:hypothetical protein